MHPQFRQPLFRHPVFRHPLFRHPLFRHPLYSDIPYALHHRCGRGSWASPGSRTPQCRHQDFISRHCHLISHRSTKVQFVHLFADVEALIAGATRFQSRRPPQPPTPGYALRTRRTHSVGQFTYPVKPICPDISLNL
jgi:hypothetical protein